MAQPSTSSSAISYFKDNELQAPNWMNKEFFTEVLRKYEKTDEILVKEVKISPAIVEGNPYEGVMFPGTVTYDIQNAKEISKSLIINTIPELDGDTYDMLGESNIFESEISLHSAMVPKFEAEFRKIGDNSVFGAEVFYYSLEPRKVIIFEDINPPKGYEVLRDRKCNMEEIKAVFLKLAKLHAVSYKLAAGGDTSVTSFKEGFLVSKTIEEIPYIASVIATYIDELKKHDGFRQYSQKLSDIERDLLKGSLKSSKISLPDGSEGIFVLCNGDFHQRNIKFKRSSSDGSIEDVILGYFEESYFGLALLDFLNGIFMLSCTNCYTEILHHYSLSFIETLKKLQYQGELPKVSDLFSEFSRVNLSIIKEMKKIVLGKLTIANLNSR